MQEFIKKYAFHRIWKDTDIKYCLENKWSERYEEFWGIPNKRKLRAVDWQRFARVKKNQKLFNKTIKSILYWS